MQRRPALHPDGLSRVNEIVNKKLEDGTIRPGILPICRASWYAGVKSGQYPQPVKLGPRTSAWRNSDLLELIERLGAA